MEKQVTKPKHKCCFCGEKNMFLVAADVDNAFKPAICASCVEMCYETVQEEKARKK